MIQPRNWLQQESVTIPRAGGTAEGRGATKVKIQGCPERARPMARASQQELGPWKRPRFCSR